MQTVLDEVDDEHDGVEAYLRTHGLSDDVLQRARARLVDGP